MSTTTTIRRRERTTRRQSVTSAETLDAARDADPNAYWYGRLYELAD